jgi:hypothetical protein
MEEDEERGGKKDHVEAHSLPGTNQAGKRPDCEKDDQENRPGALTQDQLEAHSLPGTNQAGKGGNESSPGE